MRRYFCQGNSSRLGILGLFVVLFWGMGIVQTLVAQEKERYLSGEGGQLEMIVHIIGEIKRPGEYRVSDSTNLMELISKAGGPTEFSNLDAVSITRLDHNVSANGHNGRRLTKTNKIIKYNVNDYLKKNSNTPPPVLNPGDIVLIPRNNWHKWRNAFTIVRDLSVIASVYFLYLRATN